MKKSTQRAQEEINKKLKDVFTNDRDVVGNVRAILERMQKSKP